MIATRMATVEDAELIADQRRKMFADSGQADAVAMARMVENFAAWARPRLADGSYLGWLIEDQGVVVAGAGMWLMEFPPHYLDAEPVRAYLLNIYTEPAYSGRGMAQELLTMCVEEARRRGVKVVALHASKFGRPIYARNGFADSNEMMLRDTAGE